MDTLQEGRIRFLNDMVYFFGTYPHRRNNDKRYKNEQGLKCAIGRYIGDEHKPEELQGSVKNLWRNRGGEKILEDIYTYLPFEIYELGKNFLSEVQCLYDNDRYWRDGGGLSESGQVYYNAIITQYCSPCLDYEYNF